MILSHGFSRHLFLLKTLLKQNALISAGAVPGQHFSSGTKKPEINSGLVLGRFKRRSQVVLVFQQPY